MQLHKILSILVVMIMGFSFNPIQDNDWQGLNIMLEKLFYSEAQAANKVKTKKTGSVSARKTVTIKNDASSEIADGNNIDVKIQGVDDGQGVSLYVDGGSDENVTIPDTGIIYKTQAKIAVPSSYFLDLRGIYKTTTTQQYTADILTLRDANGNTLTLQNVDETNNISMAGPIAGGRDQAAVFGDGVWVHIFIIYNPTTGDTSSVGSETATAPTLTGALAGYTFYCRVGAIYVYDAGDGLGNRITLSYQMGDRVTYNTNWIKWDTNNNSYTSIPLTAVVPATAKMVHGSMGLSAGTTARKMAVASNSGGTIKVGALCDAQGTGHTDYGVSGSKNFTLPLITPQTIWWKTETTDNIYAVGIEGFTDDL